MDEVIRGMLEASSPNLTGLRGSFANRICSALRHRLRISLATHVTLACRRFQLVGVLQIFRQIR